MFKDLLRTFLDGVIASVLYTLLGGFILPILPPLPFGLSDAIFFGVLVLIIDYILKNLARLY